MSHTIRLHALGFPVAVLLAGCCCCPPVDTGVCAPPASDAGRLNIVYRLPVAASVSINIYDAQGRVVRELTHGASRPGGCNSEVWDGRDAADNAVPPGTYTWKLLATQGLHAEYLMSLGNNYPDDSTRWNAHAPGNHGGPEAVAVDRSGVYIGASSVEQVYNTSVVKVSPSGLVRYWDAPAENESGDGVIAWGMARNGLYALRDAPNERGDSIVAYDPASGNGLFPAAFPTRRGAELPTDLAARGDHLVVCYPDGGAVQWLNLMDGSLLHEATGMPGVHSVTVASDGTVFATADGVVFKVAPGGSPQRLIEAGLENPHRIDLDESTNELLVAQGAPSHQVLRFTLGGQPVGAPYGHHGGRPYGPYQPADFREIADVTADGAGGFYVAEKSAPRRVAHFNRAGALQREWYGGQAWGSFAAPEPKHPEYVWVNSSNEEFMRLKLNYAARSWAVDAVYRYKGLVSGLVPDNENGSVWEPREHGNFLYLCRTPDPCILKVNTATGTLTASTILWQWMSHYAGRFPEYPELAEVSPPPRSFQWNDANGDGERQPPELIITNEDGILDHSPYSVDDSMNFLYATTDTNGLRVWQHSVEQWTTAQAPKYSGMDFPGSPASTQPIATSPPMREGMDPRYGAFFCRDAATGDVYGAVNDVLVPGKDNYPFTVRYPSLIKWDAQGHELWRVGKNDYGQGNIDLAFRRFAGITHGCAVVGGYSREWLGDGPTRTYVWDSDGLWVGGLFDRPDLTAANENMYSLGSEALSLSLHTDDQGQVLAFGGGINDARVYRITGWDGWHRDGGTIAVGADQGPWESKEPDPELLPPDNGTGLSGVYYRNTSSGWTGTPRHDPILEFYWGTIDKTTEPSLDPLFNTHWEYSVHWSGYVVPRSSGLYAFRSGTDATGDNKRGFITVRHRPFRSPKDERESNTSWRVWLWAGKAYKISIDYLPEGAEQQMHLQWLPPHGKWESIPTSQLFPGPTPPPNIVGDWE